MEKPIDVMHPKPVDVLLPAELYDYLFREAKRTGVKMPDMIRIACAEYVGKRQSVTTLTMKGT